MMPYHTPPPDDIPGLGGAVGGYGGTTEATVDRDEERSGPPDDVGQYETALLAMIPSRVVGAWTVIWPLLVEISPRTQRTYLAMFALGGLMTFLYAFHELNTDETDTATQDRFDRVYQYVISVAAFAIWAAYLAALTPDIPVGLLSLHPGWASVAIVVFVTLAVPLPTVLSVLFDALGERVARG